MAIDRRLTQDQIASRGTVKAIKDNPGKLTIILAGGQRFEFRPDDKLSHDIALVVQDYFRRTGTDFSARFANV